MNRNENMDQNEYPQKVQRGRRHDYRDDGDDDDHDDGHGDDDCHHVNNFG